MELEVSTDPKTVKMFRRLEKFLDYKKSKGIKIVDFFNVETGRKFGVFVTPDHWDEIFKLHLDIAKELEGALDTIEILEDDNALLDLIDAQNDVLQGRVIFDEAAGIAVGDTVEFAGLSGKRLTGTVEGIEPVLYIRTPTNEFGNGWHRKPEEVTKLDVKACAPREPSGMIDVMESLLEKEKPGGEDGVQWSFTTNMEPSGPQSSSTTNDSPPAEKSAGVFITEQEYEELLNLRVKRARDKETITGLNATARENKRGAETLSRQRDSYLAQLIEATISADKWQDIAAGRAEQVVALGFLPFASGDRMAFTADAHRDDDSDFAGYKPEDFRD